jgi:hypothetical protein
LLSLRLGVFHLAMDPRRHDKKAAQRAHQDAQRALRSSAHCLSIREATETMVRTNSDVLSPLNGEANSVEELTSRLMAKVDAAKQSRIENVMRRGTPVTHGAPGKKTAPPRLGPIQLSVNVAEDDDEEDDGDELCIIAPTGPTSLSDSLSNSRNLSPYNAECSQSSSTPVLELRSDDDDVADAVAKDKAVVESIRKRHEIRRLQLRHESLSPITSARGFAPPPADAPLLPMVQGPLTKSPLLRVATQLINTTSVSLNLQRQKSASFTDKLSAICKDGEAARIVRLNSYDHAASKTTVTFTAHRT